MKIEAWWFNSAQTGSEILQPDFFVPKTHLGIYTEGIALSLPLIITAVAFSCGKAVYEKQITLDGEKCESNEYQFDVSLRSGMITGAIFAKPLGTLPEYIRVSIQSGDAAYSQDTNCAYVTLSGRVTDFDGYPFPAAVQLYRDGFGGHIGVWCDMNGEYSVTVPKGRYNAFFVDDHSYRKSSLENWSWHMIVDRDEKHDFKVGTGEVYTMCVWANNGGFSTLFIYFRPMVLAELSKYQLEISGRLLDVVDIAPELDVDDMLVTVNGHELQKISMQKIYETGVNSALPAYVLQVRRYPESGEYSTLGKQTLIVEYSKKMDNGHMAQSQGRTQFFYHNVCSYSLM